MDFNEQMIASFRANGGDVQEPMAFGRTLVLVHVPRKDGSVLVRPLRSMADPLATGDAWHVAGSGGGSPTTPAWVHGLRRAPEVDLEIPADPDPETVRVRVEELAGAERDRMWKVFTDTEPGFAEYEVKAGDRLIPVFRFTRA